jgi:hypothetical protein
MAVFPELSFEALYMKEALFGLKPDLGCLAGVGNEILGFAVILLGHKPLLRGNSTANTVPGYPGSNTPDNRQKPKKKQKNGGNFSHMGVGFRCRREGDSFWFGSLGITPAACERRRSVRFLALPNAGQCPNFVHKYRTRCLMTRENTLPEVGLEPGSCPCESAPPPKISPSRHSPAPVLPDPSPRVCRLCTPQLTL